MKNELHKKEKILQEYIERNQYLSEYIDKEKYFNSDSNKITYKGKKAIYLYESGKELPCIVVLSKELIKGVRYVNIVIEINEKYQFIFTPESNIKYVEKEKYNE